jgi:predicted TPR repeat methyltransferase
LHEILNAIPHDVKTLIDVGCGKGIVGALVRIYRNANRLVGIDIWADYLEFCKRFNFYDELYQIDLRKMPLPFGDKEFEVATCIEVIEHLPKLEGERLLDELERIAKNVIVSTPSRKFLNENQTEENPFQQHQSFWAINDFKKRGYKVRGAGYLKAVNLQADLRILTSRIPTLFSFLIAKKET